MLWRSLWLSVVVLFVCAVCVAADDPFGKPAEKAKPAAKDKPAVQAKAGATHRSHKEAARPKPAWPAGQMQGVPPEAIARALEQPISLEVVETPLADVVEYIKDCAKIPVLTDRRALDDIGVQADSPITFNAKGLKLRSALNHLLRPLELTWMIQDEVLVITTPEQADALLETRVYEVADLVAARDEQLRLYNDFDQLINTITSTVRPTCWDTVGGPGSIAGFEATGITVLVVSHTLAVHEEVARLLGELRKAKRPDSDSGAPVRKRESAAAKGPVTEVSPQLGSARPPAKD